MIYVHDSAVTFPKLKTIWPPGAALQPSQLIRALSFINLSLVLVMALAHRRI